MSSDANHVVVLITSPADDAARLAGALVKEQLAACVNIISSVRSIYCWEDEVCDDSEDLLVVKTRADLVRALEERVVELHPYDVPEVIALPVVDGHAPYLGWLSETTRG
jgi:periplasmic divalent cation tolerance protein